MATKHTPGPWQISDNVNNHCGTGCWYQITRGDEYVCEIYAIEEKNPDIEKHEANARLIAAAPDLLAACEALLVEWEYIERMHGEHGGREVSMVRAAIAKAKRVI